ncbi:MAG: hypothetical protein HKN70_09695 [Gammaproteobacteria bacterium]|nr:hypothetical protein [Gammaproteobacteria bacterium]
MSDNNKTFLRVVVTRPARQSERLSDLIEAQGGTAIRIPALEISTAPEPLQVKTCFEQLDQYDFLVFISPNAVRFSLAYFAPAQLHEQTTVAIGASTANAMEMAGIHCDVYPRHSFTSEALLAMPEFADLQGKNILIIRGIGGRELLGREFRNRGASVKYAEVYQRSIPAKSKPLLNDVLQNDRANLLTANSVESLLNVLTITEEPLRNKLLELQLVTGSARVVEKAAELGFAHPALLAEGPDDHALMQAIGSWSPPQTDNKITDSTETTMTQNTHEPDEKKPDQPRADATPDAKKTTEASSAGDSDKLAPSATAVVQSAPPPAKKSGAGIAWLALLLAFLAFASSGWTWWQSRQQSDAIAGIDIPTTDEILADVEQETARFNAQVTRQLDGQERQLDDALRQHTDVAASLRTQQRSIETLTDQLAQMEQNLSAMRGVSANIRNTWVRAETEYFLQIANTRLQLADDVNSAVQALRAADERIVALGDPALTPVRAQISEELLALESVPPVDIEGIALSLNSIARGISKLTLKNSAPESLGRNAGTDADKSGWGRAKGVVSNAFTDIVRVSPTDDSQPALLAPEQAYFLYRNLELQIQAARIAAMQQQQQNYTTGIAFALDWLRRYFDPADTGVNVVIERLEQLRGKRVTAEMPDISGSLNMLRTLAPGRSSSALPSVPATEGAGERIQGGDAS